MYFHCIRSIYTKKDRLQNQIWNRSVNFKNIRTEFVLFDYIFGYNSFLSFCNLIVFIQNNAVCNSWYECKNKYNRNIIAQILDILPFLLAFYRKNRFYFPNIFLANFIVYSPCPLLKYLKCSLHRCKHYENSPKGFHNMPDLRPRYDNKFVCAFCRQALNIRWFFLH